MAMAMLPTITKYPDVDMGWTCGRKAPYTKRYADAVVRTRNRSLSAVEPPYNAYRCVYCGQYHVGHVRRV